MLQRPSSLLSRDGHHAARPFTPYGAGATDTPALLIALLYPSA